MGTDHERAVRLSLALASLQGAIDRMPHWEAVTCTGDSPETQECRPNLEALEGTGISHHDWFSVVVGMSQLADAIRDQLIALYPCTTCKGEGGFAVSFGYGDKEYHECGTCSGAGYIVPE